MSPPRKNRNAGLARALAGVLVFGFLACAKPVPQNPMRDQAIPAVSRLRVGIFNRGAALDRTALERCAREYPNVELTDEISVHRALRNAELTVEDLIRAPDKFEAFERIEGFHVLILTFRVAGEDRIRTVNYLGRYVSTALLDVPRPTCEDVFRPQRLVFVDSSPPLADISIDDRLVGEAPLWVWLKDGKYHAQCRLPDQTFKPIPFVVPQTFSILCLREETVGAGQAQEDEKMTAGEKAGAVLIYIAGAAAAAAAIILPLILLHVF